MDMIKNVIAYGGPRATHVFTSIFWPAGAGPSCAHVAVEQTSQLAVAATVVRRLKGIFENGE
jgi:hypothetical protein